MKRLAELVGLAAIVVGVGVIYLPAAIIAAGAGLVLWAQGVNDDSTRDDDARRP